MKTMKLNELGCGSLFTYGGIRWVVLDHGMGCELCISADIVEKREFDTENRNDFTASTLRAWLNGEFFERLIENGAEKSAFKDLILDLTSDDGQEDYGTDRLTIGLITCGMYRKLRRFMLGVKGWWWTCTPWSTARGADSDGNLVRRVDTSGALSNSNAYYGYIGVRPLCNLSSEILASVEDGEDKPREGMLLLDAIVDGLREAVTDAVNDAGGAEKMEKEGARIDVTLKMGREEESEDEGDEDEDARETHVTFEDVRSGMMNCMLREVQEFDGSISQLNALVGTYLALSAGERANREARA